MALLGVQNVNRNVAYTMTMGCYRQKVLTMTDWGHFAAPTVASMATHTLLQPEYGGCCRLKDQVGSLSSVFLYVAYFLPTSINAAWLSVATSVGLLIVPVSYGQQANLEFGALVLAAVVTIAGTSSAEMTGIACNVALIEDFAGGFPLCTLQTVMRRWRWGREPLCDGETH